MDKENHHEIESKLLVLAKHPKNFLLQIAQKSAVSGYKLIKIGRHEIRDIYFDSPDGQLKRQRLALRLRKVNDHFLLTVKGKTQFSKWGGVSRLEIELPYSLSALKEMEDVLRHHQVSLNLFVPKKMTDNPTTFLQNSSLKIIQDRETSRLIRQVISKERPEEILAEMALDTISYHLENLSVYQAEIELEAKSTKGIEAIRHIQDYLLKKHPYSLRIWTLSKLTTGLAIEMLFREGKLHSYFGDQNYLLPAVYDLILKNMNPISQWNE